MTTFVNEQVKRLDTILSQSFEKNLQVGDSIKSFSSLNENEQFLFQASQALDLTSSALPTFERVQEYLEKYHEQFSSKGSVIQSEAEAADPALEWLFVAKCTIAVYGQVFSKVLNLTLPISESIDYWNSIHGSSIQEIYYGLQSMFILATPL
jgi:nuclear-control-of-ATPase protein 2